MINENYKEAFKKKERKAVIQLEKRAEARLN